MRPLVVLLLVLAAIGALIFGVLAFLKEPPKQDAPPAVVHQSETASPAKPETLEGGGDPSKAGRATPVEVPNTNAAGPNMAAGAWQYDNTLTGSVLSPLGKPLPGCEVGLSTWHDILFVNDKEDTSQDRIIRSNDAGAFTFRNIQPRDSYKLTIKHPEYATLQMQSVAVGELGEFVEPPIKMTEGTILQGHVRDESSNGIEKAVLVLDGLEYQGADYEPPDRMTTTTDNEGWYAFPNVASGQRMLTVTAKGFGSMTINALNFAGTQPVTRDVMLRVGEMMRGRVVCGDKPIPGAIVRAFGFSNSQMGTRGDTVADATGSFTLENLTPGEYTLLGIAKGYRFDPLTRQRTNTDNIVLEGYKEADLCGKVVDAVSGNPVTTFTCRLRVSNGPGQPTMPTEMPPQSFENPKGEFCMSGVPPGEYIVEAQAGGFAPSFSAPVSVARGQTPTPTTIRVNHGASLRGRVVDPEGKPVAFARVTTHDKEWTDDPFTAMLGDQYPTNATLTDIRAGEDGRFLIGGLTPETYQINIRAAGYTRYVQTGIAVTDGNETNLGDVKLQRGGTLTGTLYGPDGKPVVGGAVALIPTEGDMSRNFTSKSGQDGKFLIMNVTPGRYTLTASQPANPDANPFEKMADQKHTQQTVQISENTTTNQVLTLGP